MTTIDILAEQLQHAKAIEEDAKNQRIEIEQKIIDALGVKDEGSQTHKGQKYKLVITGKITRTLDVEAWDKIKGHVPPELWPVRNKPEIDLTGLKWLRDNNAPIYTTVCQAISAKPAKASVTFEEVGK